MIFLLQDEKSVVLNRLDASGDFILTDHGHVTEEKNKRIKTEKIKSPTEQPLGGEGKIKPDLSKTKDYSILNFLKNTIKLHSTNNQDSGRS